MREIFASRAFVYILIAASVTAFLGSGKALWTISFFIRSHGLSTTEAGLSLAVVLGLADALGPWRGDRQHVVEGNSVLVSVDIGGRRIIHNKTNSTVPIVC